ncbi:phage holin family protein [Antarcticimicrobium sediminis]|uniref:LydA holin phage, holin superfamily III n=1 Tax=Antarcticimicrobium sediminis TaxID=2546227 RepID=A0A4R5EFU4_9RHOB|nr:phage holin family protein [Antarcticimicrobium sediminis]TDE33178.1 hypothetical protein E1B25_21540 [Antarcticimicrobium sediminis]
MVDPEAGLIEAVSNAIGGAATTLVAAFIGRAMFHAGEVRAKRRNLFSFDLIWEVPLAIGMAMIGDALGDYMELDNTVRVGLIAVLSYLGPRGAAALFERWIARKG